MHPPTQPCDLLIIGGGINGAGIARDAAGRGLSVVLCERGDLACATSSASSKLIHGGLRYLEQYEFRLVAEALAEREILLRTAPHLVTPLKFVLPWVPGMRPAWMLRLGMLLYDHLGGRSRLPRSCRLDLRTGAMAAGLKRELRQGFAYYDCRVDDARLVVLNCQAAADMGALILPRTEVVAGRRLQGQWHVSVRCDGGVRELRARALINAAGPWVRAMHGNLVEREVRHGIRLVKGSHIVLPKLYPGGHAYILQNHDRRVVLAIPYLEQFTLVGTTDVPHPSAELTPQISPEETGYLCEAVNRYFERVASPVDVVATFSGVRPLYDDGNANPSEVTRDYKLLLDEDGAPLLSIYGGKITTHRKLAEHALEKLQPFFPAMARAWTHAKSLPGGDFEDGPRLLQDLMGEYAKLPRSVLLALARRHGTLARVVLGQATTTADLGEHFGADLYAREVDYFVTREWAGCAEDILWRRTKAGIALSAAQQQALSRYVDRLGRLG